MTGKKTTDKKINIKAAFSVLIVLAGILLTQGSALAKTPQFRLDTNSLKLSLGESTSIVLSMIDAPGAEENSIEGLENFDVVSSTPSEFSQDVYGDTSYQYNIHYVIMPKKAGQFTLCGNVNYGGTTFKTNPIEITVTEKSEGGEAKDLFVKTILSDNEVYFGQKLVLSYELYSRYSIENFGFKDKVNISDFIIKEVPEDKLKADYVFVDGKKYVKYEAKQMILSPVKTGTFTIPSYKFQVNVSTGDFLGTSQAFYLQTDAQQLKVKPLPINNRPGDFSGIVGKLVIDARYSKEEIDLKDSLALNVTASGDCNLEGLKKIIKAGIPGFSVYETEKKAEESIQNNRYNVKKEFEIILVPEKNGDIKIEPISIPYFNPQTGNYEKAEIPGTTIKVTGDVPGTSAGLKGGISPAAVETVKIDQISYATVTDGYLTIKLKKHYLYITLAVLLLLCILGAAVFLLFTQRKRHDKNLLHMYRQLKNAGDENEIYNIFNSMMKYRFNLSLKASPRNLIAERLSGLELVHPVLEMMDYMESKKQPSNEGKLYLLGKVKEIYKKL